MQILITGIGRTGTTGLFSKVKNSLPENNQFLHEPKVVNSLGKNCLVKLNIFRVMENPILLTIPKKILLIRDQRDRIISSLLFGLFQTWEGKEKRLFKVLDLLKQKESSPESLSVLKLHEHLHPNWDLRNQAKKYCKGLIKFSREQKVLVYYYEEFVKQNFKPLEDYLGLPLSGSSDLGKRKYVLRTGSSGDWGNWFCKEDIDFFRPLLQKYMEIFGYEDNWNLKSPQRIPPEVASDYVLKIVNDLRLRNGLEPVDV